MGLTENNPVNKIYQDIAQLLNINVEELDIDGLKTYLEICLHRLQAERKILAQEYDVKNLEEMNRKIQKMQGNRIFMNSKLLEDYLQFARLETELAVLNQTLMTL